MYLPVPLGDLYSVPSIRSSEIFRLRPVSKLFKLAAAAFNEEYSLLTKRDYLKKLKAEAGKNAARFSPKANHASVKRSSDLIKAWLQFQFGEEWASVLRTIYKVVTQQNGLKNTIHFCGFNSGKNGTLKPLAELFVLVGFDSGHFEGRLPFSCEYN